MPAAKSLAWLLPLALVSTTAALGQAPGASLGGSSTGSTVRGPGLSAVPNNNVPPLTASGPTTTNPPTSLTATPSPGFATPSPRFETPSPGFATPSPLPETSPSFTLSLPPPSGLQSPTAPDTSLRRTCPSGVIVC